MGHSFRFAPLVPVPVLCIATSHRKPHHEQDHIIQVDIGVSKYSHNNSFIPAYVSARCEWWKPFIHGQFSAVNTDGRPCVLFCMRQRRSRTAIMPIEINVRMGKYNQRLVRLRPLDGLANGFNMLSFWTAILCRLRLMGGWLVHIELWKEK